MLRFQYFPFFEKMNKEQLKMVNSTTKNGQITLYCHFNEIIKGPGASFLSPTLGQKYFRNVFHTAH